MWCILGYMFNRHILDFTLLNSLKKTTNNYYSTAYLSLIYGQCFELLWISYKLTCPWRICCLLLLKSYKIPTWAQVYMITFLVLSVRFKTGTFLFKPKDQMIFWSIRKGFVREEHIYNCKLQFNAAWPNTN